MNPKDVPINLVVAVWGVDYTKLFVDVCLPSLLSPNNIHALMERDACEFRIYTTRDDGSAFQRSPAFEILSGQIAVELCYIERDSRSDHDLMSECHRRALEKAKSVDAALVFIPPDSIWSDGSLAALIRIFNQGYRAVFTSGIRVRRESFLPAVQSHYDFSDLRELRIDAIGLCRIAFKHLHQAAKEHMWRVGEGRRLLAPGLCWRIGDEGLLLRFFHLHPLLIYPRNKKARLTSTIDGDFVELACPDPKDHYVVTDSDEILFFEISPISHVIMGNVPKESVGGVANWARFFASRTHLRMFQKTILLHTGKTDSEDWEGVKHESDLVVKQVLNLIQKPSSKFAYSFLGRIPDILSFIFGPWPMVAKFHWHWLWVREFFGLTDNMLAQVEGSVLWLFSDRDPESASLQWLTRNYSNVRTVAIEHILSSSNLWVDIRSVGFDKFAVVVADLPLDAKLTAPVLALAESLLQDGGSIIIGKELLKPWSPGIKPMEISSALSNQKLDIVESMFLGGPGVFIATWVSRMIHSLRCRVSRIPVIGWSVDKAVCVVMAFSMPLINFMGLILDSVLIFLPSQTGHEIAQKVSRIPADSTSVIEPSRDRGFVHNINGLANG